MTLTEEQRAALKRVAAYMDEMYSVASPYHGCTEDSDLLRDMIDSSGTVEPTGGFDLERARGLRDFLQDDCAEVGDVWGEMIAEIERLRASLTDLHAEYINTLEKNPGCSAWDLDEQSIGDQRRLRRNAAHAISIVEPPIYLQADQQAAKILELEAISRRRNEIINKQVAKIKELEEALVEMVATNPCNIPTLCDVVHDELMCPALDGNCDFWKGCPQKNELREAARKQLQAEGKIGNSEHFTDASKMIWQITEERVGLLEYCLETLLDAPDIEEIPGPGHSIEVLRAMLTEAGL